MVKSRTALLILMKFPFWKRRPNREKELARHNSELQYYFRPHYSGCCMSLGRHRIKKDNLCFNCRNLTEEERDELRQDNAWLRAHGSTANYPPTSTSTLGFTTDSESDDTDQMVDIGKNIGTGILDAFVSRFELLMREFYSGLDDTAMDADDFDDDGDFDDEFQDAHR